MFRLHKNREAKSGEKIDFKFTNFKAVQVPKGWDKLFISVVFEQTGKTIVKSSKASVRNGSCQWTESLSESIWVSQDKISKEFEDCNFKLVVAMGTTRSNILGEAVVNMTNYTDSKSSAAVSLPLKKCNFGTVLQVKIQCLTPVRKVRNGDLEQTNSPKEDSKKDGHDSDSCSDSQLSRNVGSFSGTELSSSFHSGQASSKEACFSASSQLSYDPADVPELMENYSAKSNGSDIQRQDSASSRSSAPCSSPSSVITGSEGTMIEELRAEAKMWERNARKLMVDLDQLKKEFSDQSQNQESLNTSLSAATAECDGLRKELEQLKKLLTEKPIQRQTAIEDLSYEDGEPHLQRELKDELKFQKESNADLALQLQRSQESNIELVSVLQELEATNEKQMLEIEKLLGLGVKGNDMENILQENKKLMLQLEHVKESERNLQLMVQTLERNLEETKHDLKKYVVRSQRFSHETDMDSDGKLYCEEDLVSVNSVDMDLVKEIEVLKEKVQELEKDCNELTDENIELLYKLKQANNNPKEGGLAFNSTGDELLSNSFVNFGFNTKAHKYPTQNLEEKLEEIPGVTKENDGPSNKKLESMKFELEVKVEELNRELAEKKLQIEKLESSVLFKEDEIKILGDSFEKLQVKCSDLQKEKNQIEEQMDVILRESDINSRCLSGLQNEVKVLTNSVDFQVSANKILERKSMELESKKRELEEEHIQLAAQVSSLESQLRIATNEKEYQMRKRNELHESNLHLELKLKKLYGRIEQCFRQVDDFEDSLSLRLKDFASKVNVLSSELDSLVEENKRYEGTLAMFESLCNETYLEKTTEVQKPQDAVAYLTKQLSATQSDLNIIQTESDEKLSSLISELSMSKQNHDILVAENESLSKQLEHYKSLEVKFNNYVDDLELKLSMSEKEQEQHIDELTDLQLEVLALRNKPEATKTEREKVEAGFNLISKECENLRTENNFLRGKITLLQKTVTELEDSQYQQKLKVLVEEKDEYLKRSQSLEAELKLLKEEKQTQREFSSGKVHGVSKTNGKNMTSKDTKLLKNDVIKVASQNHNGKKSTSKSSQPLEPVKDVKNTSSNQSPSKIKDDSGFELQDEAPHTPGADSISRIQVLEKELAEALEASNYYKDVLNRLVSGNQPNPQILMVEGDVATKESSESTKSALEAELKDLRERYFHMSLKYAEVEHQREELVMKLKAANSGRRWFS